MRAGLTAAGRALLGWDRRRLAALARFAAVGLLSSGLYAGVMLLAIRFGGVAPGVASALGYAAALPVNFGLHRSFTFASRGRIRREALRFLLLHGINMALSMAIVHLMVTVAGLPAAAGALAVVLAIPLLQFIALESWVYGRPPHSREPP